MFDLRIILKKIQHNEINAIDLSNEVCPDYTKTPEIAILNLDSDRHPSTYTWQNIVVLSNNRFACSAGNDIYIWDSKEKKCINVINSVSYIKVLLSLADGRLLSAHNDSTVKLWDINNNKLLGVLLKIDSSISCMSLLSDEYVLIGSTDGLIRIIYLSLGQIALPVLGRHVGCIRAISCYKESHVASVDVYNNLIRWSIGADIQYYVIKLDFAVYSLCVDLYGYVVLGDFEGNIRYNKSSSDNIENSLKISRYPIFDLKNTPDGKMIASSAEGILCYFDLIKPKILQAINISSPCHLKFIEVLQDGEIIAAGDDGKIFLLQFPTRIITAEDVWLIILALEDNYSVSTINFNNVEFKDINVNDLFSDLLEKRRDLNIRGVQNLNRKNDSNTTI